MTHIHVPVARNLGNPGQYFSASSCYYFDHTIFREYSFNSVAQTKNEDRDIEELRQLCTTISALMLRSKPTLLTPSEKMIGPHEQYLSEYINTDFQTGTVRVDNSLLVLSYFLSIIK